MDRERIIEKLRQHEAELKRAGITRLSLFGSMARAEPGNDVDLIAEFDGSKRLTLLDMAGLGMRLAEIVRMPVDLAPAKMQPVWEEAARKAVVAF
jgi:predicted nucleotidyltransferase